MPKNPKIHLKEIPWDESQTCIYANGHIGPVHFLEAVKHFTNSDVPSDARDALTLEHVMHTRFSRMSPSEAAARGVDWGFWETQEGRYKVTAVFLG